MKVTQYILIFLFLYIQYNIKTNKILSAEMRKKAKPKRYLTPSSIFCFSSQILQNPQI